MAEPYDYDVPSPHFFLDILLSPKPYKFTGKERDSESGLDNFGWITFRVRSDEDSQHALWLMRLSYFRYALKTAPDPHGLLAEASRELQLTAQFKSLLGQFVPSTSKKEIASSARTITRLS
jgi:hypothetical protein